MLRAVSDPSCEPEDALPETVRVSSGSAAVLGLAAWQLEVPPTTAYLMVGDRCDRNCAFCAQARDSAAHADRLSRVNWPGYPAGEVVDRLTRAYASGAVERCCLQVTAAPHSADTARRLAQGIRRACGVPLCLSIRVPGLEPLAELLDLGAERVTLAVDAACERVYRQVKGADWQRTLDLLEAAAAQHPGHVGTHLIAGLGETEAEAAGFLQRMHDLGIMTALFAFTPVPGTALAGAAPPPLAGYRRIQVARHLIVGGHAHAGQFRLSLTGQITSFGLERLALEALLQSGEAFRTSGCPGCNRPYYNERPSGPLYNYPRPLRPAETAEAVALVMQGLED